MLDPDLTSVVVTLVVAGALALPRLTSDLRHRRRVRRVCGLCGRLLVLGERTCDCEPEAKP
jgi:hypothetical protein